MSEEPVASTSSTFIHHKPHGPSQDEGDKSKAGETITTEDEDTLLEDLEDDLDDDILLGGFRERRMEELRAQMLKAQLMKQSKYGKYTEVKVEKDLIATTAKAKRSIVHFFHRDFRRCKIMDSHLEKLAAKHFDTLFLKAEVSNVPFLVTKMDVKVLPCVIGFVNGISKMKIVGFDELEGGDNFNTASLELGLIQCGVIDPNPSTSKPIMGAKTSREDGHQRRIRDGRREGKGSEEDSDFDD